MSNRKKRNKRFSRKESLKSRNANTRTEKKVDEEKPLMLFSFKDYQYNSQIPPGQSYKQWQEEKLLAYMLTKYGYVCNENRIEAEQKKLIKVYGRFPSHSKFANPFPNEDLDWAVVMKIGGQMGRVVGHVIGHVFYVVFLDAEHKFYPSEK